ncbi:MAG: hypothetical protein PHY08_12200 [Candidatus Cloacimonetes bacterium]|nr:hypothetical protein [Candidatus Cloacimonadota bacterium]
MSANIETLSSQGVNSSIDNFKKIIKAIDEQFEIGYAKEHPELVGQMLIASNIDYAATLLNQSMELLSNVISENNNG